MAQKDSYEESLGKLEEIITHLEKGEITLEEGLSSFEKGISLLKKCQDHLERAAQRVQVLKKGELVDLLDLGDEKGAE